jgi:hypothetical protein
MSSKDWKPFRTNSTKDRLGRLSVPKAKRYMTLREEGKTIEEALDIVAPVADKTEQLVLNTNPEEDKDGNETGT